MVSDLCVCLLRYKVVIFSEPNSLLHQPTVYLSLPTGLVLENLRFVFFTHEESIWESLPNLVHFISQLHSPETCVLQLLKLGVSSRLLDFISYNLSSFILNSALRSQNDMR